MSDVLPFITPHGYSCMIITSRAIPQKIQSVCLPIISSHHLSETNPIIHPAGQCPPIASSPMDGLHDPCLSCPCETS